MSSNRSLPLIFLLVGPALAGLLVFRLLPIGQAVTESFFSTFRGKSLFVGFENYLSLVGDPIFWNSLRVTLLFNLIINPLQVALALMLAVLYVREFPGIRIYRILFLVPIGVSLPTAVIIWRIMLSPDGLANGLLHFAGLSTQPWLTSQTLALYAIIAIATWKGISYWMVFIVGGLQNIPGEIYEAARVDGVKPWQQVLFITLPLLKSTLLFVLIADISINFLLFAPVFMITKGGPADSTDVLMYEAYKSGFIFGDTGRSMAIVIVIVVIVLVIVGLQFRLLGNKKVA